MAKKKSAFEYDEATQMYTIEGVEYHANFFKRLRYIYDGDYSMVFCGKHGAGIRTIRITNETALGVEQLIRCSNSLDALEELGGG